jgi:hypothetical protein
VRNTAAARLDIDRFLTPMPKEPNMPISQISATGTAAAVARPAWDTRRYWRVLLAIVAPLPLLGLGASYVISQIPSDGPFKSLAAAAAAHHRPLSLPEHSGCSS